MDDEDKDTQSDAVAQDPAKVSAKVLTPHDNQALQPSAAFVQEMATTAAKEPAPFKTAAQPNPQKIYPEAVDPHLPSPAKPEPISDTESKDKPKSKSVIKIIGIVVVLVIIGWLIYYVTQNYQLEKKVPTPKSATTTKQPVGSTSK